MVLHHLRYPDQCGCNSFFWPFLVLIVISMLGEAVGEDLQVVKTKPVHRELVVSPKSQLVLTFSEVIQAGAGSVKVEGCGVNESAVTQISTKGPSIWLALNWATVTLPSKAMVSGRCSVTADNNSFVSTTGAFWAKGLGRESGSWVFSLLPTWKTLSKPPLMVGTRWAHNVLVSNGIIVLLGGRNEFRYFNDVWHSSDVGNSWSLIAAACPWSRRAASATVALKNGTLFVLGGNDGSKSLAEVWIGHDLGKRWADEARMAPWEPREELGAALLGEDVFVAGGYNRGASMNDIWWGKAPHLEWTVVGTAAFSPRQSFSMLAPIIRPGCLLVLGGTDALGVAHGDVWQSCSNGSDWELLTKTAPFAGLRRFRVAEMPVDGSLHAIGGRDEASVPPENSGKWAVSLDGGKVWSIRSTEAPARADFGLAASNRSELLIVGGFPGNLQDVWIHRDPIETRIARTFPAAGARDVPVSTNLELFFTEPVQVDTSWGDTAELRGDTTTTTEPTKIVKLLASSARVRGSQVTFALSQLHPATKYTLYVPNGLFRDYQSGDGFGVRSNEIEFRTLSNIRCRMAPETRKEIENGMGPKKEIIIIFTGEIKPHDNFVVVTATHNGELSPHSFQVHDNDVVQVRENNLRIIPSLAWQSGAWHSVRIARGVLQDANGFLLDECWIPNAFRVVDWQIPRVVRLSPPHRALQVDMRSLKLSVNFSEPVKRGQGYVSILPMGRQRSMEIHVQNQSLISVEGAGVTITIPKKLHAPQRIAVTIDSGAFMDLSGNPCEQLTEAEWVFGIRDFSGPRVDTTQPQNGEKDVKYDVQMTVLFSDDVEPGYGRIMLRGGITASGLWTDVRSLSKVKFGSDTFNARNEDVPRIDGNILSIRLSTPLLPDMKYTLSLSEGIVEDSLGNPNEEFQISFQTIPSRPFLKRWINSFSNNASAVDGEGVLNPVPVRVDEPIVLTFNEFVVPGDGWVVLAPRVSDANQTAAALNISDPKLCQIYRNNVTLNPTRRAWLRPSTLYSLHFSPGSLLDKEAGEEATWPRGGFHFQTSWHRPRESKEIGPVSSVPRSVVMPDTVAIVGVHFIYSFSESLLVDDPKGYVWDFVPIHTSTESKLFKEVPSWLHFRLPFEGKLEFHGTPETSGNISVRLTATSSLRTSVVATFKVIVLNSQAAVPQKNQPSATWWVSPEGVITAWALCAVSWLFVVGAPSAYLLQRKFFPRRSSGGRKLGTKPKPIFVMPSSPDSKPSDSPHQVSSVRATPSASPTGKDSTETTDVVALHQNETPTVLPIRNEVPMVSREPEDEAAVLGVLQKVRKPSEAADPELKAATSTLRPQHAPTPNTVPGQNPPSPVALRGMVPSSLRPKWIPSARRSFNDTLGSSDRAVAQIQWKQEEQGPLGRLERLAQQNKRFPGA